MIEKTISVRELAETAARSGNIDSRWAASVRAVEGTRLHKLLQKSDEGEYETEVTLRAEYECGGVLFHLSGRADGVIHLSDGGKMIDEIKTTLKSVANIEENDYPAHWAQAVCYARMYCERENLDLISVRLTYYQADSGEIRRFTRNYSLVELAEHIEALLQKCVYIAKWENDWHEHSRAAMVNLPFPYEEFRPGQRKFAGEVYRAARDGKTLCAMAPTGTGKTMSALFPSVRALGEGHVEKVFYLTAKETVRNVAAAAVRELLFCGMRAKTAVITAKDKICPLAERQLSGDQKVSRKCDPEFCGRAKGHFDRVDDAIRDTLERGSDLLDRDEISRAAAERNVCPFELSLDLATYSDIIICDYNYVFDPKVNLKRFFTEGGDYALLIDEAHNLPSRSREMYSTTLEKSVILSAHKVTPKTAKKQRSALSKLNKTLLELGRAAAEQGGEIVAAERPLELDKAVSKAADTLEEYLAESSEAAPEVLEAYWSLLDYNRACERFGDNYAVITRPDKNGASVRLFCANPSEYLANTLSLTRSAVFFSATLTPPEYYAMLFGASEETELLSLPSPFPRENFMPVIADFVSTRYRDRADSLDPLAELIYTCYITREGNYIAFFPSYIYMDDVFTRFSELYPDVPTVCQARGMDTASRDKFLAEFDSPDRGLIGFCVMGGVFAEGVDFAGDRAVGVIIAGTGLPGIDTETEILREYNEAAYGAGYDYAYVYPGMVRVLQSAGRVIRSAEDKGIALLVDDRFTRAPYRSLFPKHWSHRTRVRSVDELVDILREFWKGE